MPMSAATTAHANVRNAVAEHAPPSEAPMDEPSDDDRDVRALFGRLSAVAAGSRSIVACEAVKDLLAGIIASAADNPEDAATYADAVCEDLKATIRMNWSWYRAQVETPGPRQ